MKTRRALGLFVLIFSCHGIARAQITIVKNVGDRTVVCTLSGLQSDLNDCGADAGWNRYVFVGLISSVTPAENYEKKIQIVPEEVFLGAPVTPLTVLTSQGDCLGDLKVGDRWLFYLRPKEGKPIVLDYGSGSRPIADAQDQISTLRRLKNIGNSGILRGQVVRGWWPDEGRVVRNAHVIAKRQSDNQQYVCITDAHGRYEFPPLPPGKYEITVQPIRSFRPDGQEVEITGGVCWDLKLSRFRHTEIGGHVRRSDGAPVANVDVVLMSADNTSYETTQTDQDGRFVFSGEVPGKYVLGLNFPARPDWFNGGGAGVGVRIPPASVFYPGVPDRSKARVIRLATEEKLENLDFIVPAK
ncbi:MAG: carboxypeptidase regulatory-like domain-containing protein [Candidatus Acidiferrales bacterium]